MTGTELLVDVVQSAAIVFLIVWVDRLERANLS